MNEWTIDSSDRYSKVFPNILWSWFRYLGVNQPNTTVKGKKYAYEYFNNLSLLSNSHSLGYSHADFEYQERIMWDMYVKNGGLQINK
jgi:hypothetical protein